MIFEKQNLNNLKNLQFDIKTGKIELIGNAMPIFRNDRIYKTFTAEIDLNGHPTYHSSAIPATFYEAVKTETISFDVVAEVETYDEISLYRLIDEQAIEFHSPRNRKEVVDVKEVKK